MWVATKLWVYGKTCWRLDNGLIGMEKTSTITVFSITSDLCPKEGPRGVEFQAI